MKLLVISAAFPPFRAGESDHALHLCRHLTQHGVDVHLLTRRMGIPMNSNPFKVYPCIRSWTWSSLPAVAGFLWRCAPDAILLLYTGWIYDDHPMITFLPSFSKRIRPHATFVTQFETMEECYPRSIPTRAVRKAVKHWARPEHVDYSFGTLLRDSDRIITLSHHHLSHLTQHLPTVTSKCVVIPAPPLIRFCRDDDRTARLRGREKLGVTPHQFLIAYFGYVDPTKGVETLLKAIQIVTNQGSDVRLVMVGGGSEYSISSRGKRSEVIANYQQSLRDLITQLGIANKVIWTRGYESDSDEASRHLCAADACVLPFDDGIRLNRSTFAAAAAHGLPIITTKGEILEPPFIDQRNVLLCPPKDPKALAMAIDSLISNPELLQDLRTGALELADHWFSWDKAVALTITTLKSAK